MRTLGVIGLAMGGLAFGVAEAATTLNRPAKAARIPAKTHSRALTISDVAVRNLTGLSVDESEQGAWTLLRAQARDFVDFRRRRMDPKRKLAWISDCVSKPGENIYCEYINVRAEAYEASVGGGTPQGVEPEIPKIVEQLRKAELDSLRAAPESRVLRALKQFSGWKDLELIASRALSAGTCPGTGLLTALGLKAEEYFPEQKYRQVSRALYARASECDGEKDSAYKARYRLSLMQVWAGECANALPLLQQLADKKGGDYVARGLFWTAHCAMETGDTARREQAIARLRREYPLSYHGLLIPDGRPAPAREVLANEETRLLIRSERLPEVNAVVRAVEALQSLKVKGAEAESIRELSREMLESVSDRLSSTETGFRLYVACLMAKARMNNGVFRTLASIFRDEPQAISRGALELFYPLKRFDDLKRYGWRVDPFLVAALIRQESGFNEQARSSAGALGLMQLMPDTARRMERVSRRELLDAKTNIRLGVKYFDQLLVRYQHDAELALAAYNAGPEKVDDWRRRYPIQHRMLFLDLIPYRETRDYVSLIARNYYWYLNLYGEGAGGAKPARTVASASSRSAKKPLLFTLFER